MKDRVESAWVVVSVRKSAFFRKRMAGRGRSLEYSSGSLPKVKPNLRRTN